MSDQVKLKTGALALLGSLKGKIILVLASMNNKLVIYCMLTACNVRDFFDVTLSADAVLNPKPNAEIFLKSASKLGLQPEQCVVIADLVLGVRTAKAARMTCVTIFSGTTSKSELEQERPDIKVASLDEKEVILEFIFFS